MLTHFAAALGVLGLLTVVPGPDMAVVTRRALAGGPADALRTVGGIAAGLLVWGVLTVAGLAAALAASPVAYLVVKLLGAGYLVFLGGQALWQNRRACAAADAAAAERGDAGGPGGPGATAGNPWRTGLISNVLNPKIAVFYTGLLPTLAPPGMRPVPAMAVLVLLHVALTLTWLSSYTLLLSKAAPVLEKPHIHRTLGRTTGLVLITFGVVVATTAG